MAGLHQERVYGLSWLSIAVVGFCGLLLANALYLNLVYHAEGIYFSPTLLLAFVAASRGPDWFVQAGFKLFCGFLALIAVWALVQWLTGWGFIGEEDWRAHAVFATPNTLATALNLGLVPVLGYYLLGRGGRGAYALTLLLFAALLAAQSRGGYLGLLAAMLFLLGFIGKNAVVAQWQRYGKVAAGFFAVYIFFKVCDELELANWSKDSIFATIRHGDTSYRWEIYQLTWAGLPEHLWLGFGYFNFGYYFEVHKVPPLLNGSTHFVHNDYLQFAFETGLLGLCLFLLLIAAVYVQLFRFRKQALHEQRLPLILSAAAITSMLAHALVDYPFYIPVLLAVFGAYLGVIDQQLIGMGARHWQPSKIPGWQFLGLSAGFISNMLAIGLLAWLGLPAFADVAANYGLDRLQQGDAQRGVFWHGAARILQPREANYYWREGIIWRDQGIAQDNPELLEKSASLFSKGLEVNPFEVNNLLEKIALYRQYGAQLKQPATRQDIMSWINQAKSLQPYSDFVQMEYVRCLDFVGERAKAIEQAQLLLHKRPTSKTVQKLLESMTHE